MSHVPSLGYLYHYSASLSALPEETAIFVVERSIDSDRSEVEAVFLDRAAATLWIERRPAPGDLRILPFSTFRNRNSDLVYLRPGTPRPTNPLIDGARHGNINSPENLTVDNCPQCSALLSDDPMASARADIENGCVELNR